MGIASNVKGVVAKFIKNVWEIVLKIGKIKGEKMDFAERIIEEVKKEKIMIKKIIMVN